MSLARTNGGGRPWGQRLTDSEIIGVESEVKPR